MEIAYNDRGETKLNKQWGGPVEIFCYISFGLHLKVFQK